MTTTMRLRLPPHMIFHHDLHLLVLKLQGTITQKRIEKDIEFLEAAEDRAKHPFNRFTDASKVEAFDLGFREVFRISLHRRLTYGKRAPVKSAFFVTSADAARIVQTHAMLTDHSPIRVRMFHDLPSAAKWLGVSVADLEAGH